MQELGALPIQLSGSAEQRRATSRGLATGECSPPSRSPSRRRGAILVGITKTATHDGDDYVLNGSKRFITHLGVANFYIFFALTHSGDT